MSNVVFKSLIHTYFWWNICKINNENLNPFMYSSRMSYVFRSTHIITCISSGHIFQTVFQAFSIAILFNHLLHAPLPETSFMHLHKISTPSTSNQAPPPTLPLCTFARYPLQVPTPGFSSMHLIWSSTPFRHLLHSPSLMHLLHEPPFRHIFHAPPFRHILHAPPFRHLLHAPPFRCLLHVPPFRNLVHVPPFRNLVHAPH